MVQSPKGAESAFPLPYDNIIPKIFDKIQSPDYCSGHVMAYFWAHDGMCFGSDTKRIRIRENDCYTHGNVHSAIRLSVATFFPLLMLE